MRNVSNTEMNAGTYDVSRLPLRAATCTRSSCGIVHAGIFVVIYDMGELSLEYLRSGLHHIRVLLQRSAGLGDGGTLLYTVAPSIRPSSNFACNADKQTISTS